MSERAVSAECSKGGREDWKNMDLNLAGRCEQSRRNASFLSVSRGQAWVYSTLLLPFFSLFQVRVRGCGVSRLHMSGLWGGAQKN